MTKFSSAVILRDTNDYIAPSQACINPSSLNNNFAKKSQHESYLVQKDEGQLAEKKKATINLNDCLACSGCVTSAEAVLISLQSQDEIYSLLEENRRLYQDGKGDDGRILFISLSPQTRASFATKYCCSLVEAHRKLTWFFCEYLTSKGSNRKTSEAFLVDSGFARDLSILYTAQEFSNRLEKNENLPLLVSSCPGFVCYVEKTQGEALIPYLSTIRSPQQIMGVLLKKLYTGNIESKSIYHLSIMPCFDKKLEASREQFIFDDQKEVDCVLSTIEVENMIVEEGLDFKTMKESNYIHPLFTEFKDLDGDLKLSGIKGSTSGSYWDYTLDFVTKRLYQGRNVCVKKQIKSNDLVEHSLYVDGEFKLRFMGAYGFRNIQNVIRKMKSTSQQDKIHFIEIMACPSGCINGGGQLKPTMTEGSRSITALKTFVKDAEKKYFSYDVERILDENPFVDEIAKNEILLKTWFNSYSSDQSNYLNW